MMKYLKILFLSFFVIGLMSASAFAGAQLNAGNTTLAAELISPTVDYAVGPTLVNTAYQVGAPVAATTVIRLSLTNGKFTPGHTIGIFDPNTGILGTGVVPPAPNNTRVDITLTQPLGTGTVYQFWNLTLGPPLTGITIPAGTPAGSVVTLSVSNETNKPDPNVDVSAPAITVKNQFSATLAPVTSKLDFADNMETFIVPAPVPTRPPRTKSITESQAGLRIISDETINDKLALNGGPGPCNWTLGAGDSIKIKLTGDLTGISALEYEGVSTTTYNITATDRTNGYATLNLPGDKIDICKSSDTNPFNSAFELTAENKTGTSIVPGVRTAQITLGGGGLIPAGYSRELVSAGSKSHDIQLDATRFYIPLVGSSGDGSRETYIKLQSKSTVPGGNGVKVTIITSDGSTVTYDKGTISAGTPLVITGKELVEAATAQGKSVDGVMGFAVIVTVNAPETDVFAYANIIDPSGAKRIPVKTVGGTIVE